MTAAPLALWLYMVRPRRLPPQGPRVGDGETWSEAECMHVRRLLRVVLQAAQAANTAMGKPPGDRSTPARHFLAFVWWTLVVIVALWAAPF